MGYRLHREENLENQPTRFYSNRQEKQTAKVLSGRKNKNSGATMFQPGDVQTLDFLIECKTKTVDSQSISIKKDWFEKNKEESVLAGTQFSAIAFNFGPSDKENYYIIDEHTFILMKDALEKVLAMEGAE